MSHLCNWILMKFVVAAAGGFVARASTSKRCLGYLTLDIASL
jgi:hypothetical protein